tara:strand:+ start:6080 stop:6802 length:723 start_codon:yes stop_codon:yes gene_type:complete
MPLGNKVLVTGAASGLGKYIASNVECVALTRDNSEYVFKKYHHFDVIIHCAFNASKDTNNYYKILEDNIFLTKRLCALSHDKFVFLSSVDIYQEEDNLYKTTKLMAESIVRQLATSPLIVRASAIIGPTMRKNSLLRILDEDNPTLSLSGDSTFNYVLQSDILSMIKVSANNNYSGIMDFVASKNIRLKDVAKHFSKTVNFGDYLYETPVISNRCLQEKFPTAWYTSLGNIERFIKERSE